MPRYGLEDLDLSPGKRARLYRMLHQHGPGGGIAMFLPVDQGLEHGPRDFRDIDVDEVEGDVRPLLAVWSVVGGRPDDFAASLNDDRRALDGCRPAGFDLFSLAKVVRVEALGETRRRQHDSN